MSRYLNSAGKIRKYMWRALINPRWRQMKNTAKTQDYHFIMVPNKKSHTKKLLCR
ncbi:Protein of unknown function [Pyronema omphalodes CBS 100304]|uniref:Uncharacterized protein n=1 Tax=Pyronema omphalodes (strain CBS 100304) TaxID=1076935 RepID=U4LTN2_PYROM|nr:Protein of unknown function [Pyronema omphalodes CBS 100304]